MKLRLTKYLAIIATIYIARCSAVEEPLIANRKYKPWSDEIKSASESKVIMEPITSSNEKAPRFSIGLGTLSPSYSQKFGSDGRTRLDVNSDKNGYSYSLSNIEHPSSASSATSSNLQAKSSDRSDNKGYNPSHYYQPGQPQFSIFQNQGTNNAPQPFYNQVPVVYGNLPNGQYPLHPLASGVNFNNAAQPWFAGQNYQNSDQKQSPSNSDIKSSSAQQQSSTSSEPNNSGHSGVGYGQQPYGYPLMNPMLEEYVRAYQMLQQATNLYPTAVSPYSGQQPFGQQSQIGNNYGLNPLAAYGGYGGYGTNGPMSAAASNPILSILGLTGSPVAAGYGGYGGMGGGVGGFPYFG